MRHLFTAAIMVAIVSAAVASPPAATQPTKRQAQLDASAKVAAEMETWKADSADLAAIAAKMPKDILPPTYGQPDSQARIPKVRKWAAANADGKQITLAAFSTGSAFIVYSQQYPAFVFRISAGNKTNPLPAFARGQRVRITGTIGKGGLLSTQYPPIGDTQRALVTIVLTDAQAVAEDAPTTKPQ